MEDEVKPKKKRRLRKIFLWLLLIFIVASTASYIYSRILEERIHQGNNSGSDNSKPLPEVVDSGPVTFLIIGCDKRPTESDNGRSDTLMVFRMNPDKKIAYLISIPRDSRVNIPGYGKQKINAAYAYGGPDLSIETVSKTFDIEINHYIVIDFQGFKQIVDSLGGIDINVEKKIRDSFDAEHVNLDPGMHHFDGREALDYVRVRHVDDDFGRMGRQQQFLRAVMDKLKSMGGILRIPWLIDIASHNIRTDSGLGIEDMISCGKQIASIGRENINMITLPGDSKRIGLEDFVILDQQKADWILERVNNDMPLELTPEEKQNKIIKIAVKNGSGRPGMAKEMAGKLASQNFRISEISNTMTYGYSQTQIIAPPDKVELAQKVRDQLGLGQVVTENITSSKFDVLVIVGQDFANR